MQIPATVCLCLLFACICTLNPNNSNYKTDSLITSDATGSHKSHTTTAHPSVALGWDSTFSFKQNLLWLTHSLLDNKSEFTSFFTTHPCTAKRVLCVCVETLSPYVSTDEETGWEKSFTCGHTHGRHRIMSPVACKTESRMTVHHIKTWGVVGRKKTFMHDVAEEQTPEKTWQHQGEGGKGWAPFSAVLERRLPGLAIKTSSWPLTQAGFKRGKDECKDSCRCTTALPDVCLHMEPAC